MKWIAAPFLLFLLQAESEKPRLVDPIDPPQRVDLRVGARTVRIDLGVTVPARDGLPELRAELCPTREFVAPGAFAFEFPRAWAFSGGANGPEGWWSVSADGAMVHMQRHVDDPIAVRDLYVKNSLAAFPGATATDRTLVLGGRGLAARSIEFTQGSMHGAQPVRVRQDVVGFRAGSAAWVLVVNRQGPDASAPALIDTSGAFRFTSLPAPTALPATTDLDALVASFRWL